jgi:hypothetical protein
MDGRAASAVRARWCRCLVQGGVKDVRFLPAETIAGGRHRTYCYGNKRIEVTS